MSATGEPPQGLAVTPTEPMSQQSQVQNSDIGVFQYSLSFQLLTVAFLLATLVLAGSAAVLHYDPHRRGAVSPLLREITFGVLAVLTASFLRKLWDRVAVDTEGIRYIPRRGKETTIAWADVGAVIVNDFGQRFILVDIDKCKTISLGYQLFNFARLRDTVVARTGSVVSRDASSIKIFYRSWVTKGYYLCFVFGPGFLAWKTSSGSSTLSVVFLSFAAVSLALFAFDTSRLIIKPTSVEIVSLIRTRAIGFADISSIKLVYSSQKGYVWFVVMLQLKGGRPIRLSLFREGALTLHQALRAAHAVAG